MMYKNNYYIRSQQQTKNVKDCHRKCEPFDTSLSLLCWCCSFWCSPRIFTPQTSKELPNALHDCKVLTFGYGFAICAIRILRLYGLRTADWRRGRWQFWTEVCHLGEHSRLIAIRHAASVLQLDVDYYLCHPHGMVMSSAFLVYGPELQPGYVCMISGAFFDLFFGLGGIGSAPLVGWLILRAFSMYSCWRLFYLC